MELDVVNIQDESPRVSLVAHFRTRVRMMGIIFGVKRKKDIYTETLPFANVYLNCSLCCSLFAICYCTRLGFRLAHLPQLVLWVKRHLPRISNLVGAILAKYLGT